MFKKLKIGTKITALVIGVVLASVIVVSIIAYNLSKDSINSRYAEAINVVANLKAQKVETFFENIKNEIQFGKELQVVQQKILAESNLSQQDSTTTTEQKEALNTQLNIIVNNIIGYKDVKNVYLTDNAGSLLYQAEDRGQNIDSILRGFNADVMRSASQGGVLFSGVSQKNKTLYALAQVDGADAKNANIGKIIYEINLDYIYNLVKDSTGLGGTGETMLVQKNRNYAIFLSPSRHQANLEKIRIGSNLGVPAQRSIRDKNTKKSEVTLDYRGEQVLATWRNIKSINWGVTVKVDQKEVSEPTDRLFNTFLFVGGLITLLSIVIGFAFSRFLIRPLLVLKDTINLLAKGILPDKLRQSTTDEIGEMTVQLNELVGTLKKTADFA